MQWHIATFRTLLKNTKQHCNMASCAKANIFWTVNPAHNHWTCWLAQFWLGLHMLHLSSGIIRSYAISWPDTTFVFKLKHRLSHSTHKHEQELNQKHTITYLTLPCLLISFSSCSLAKSMRASPDTRSSKMVTPSQTDPPLTMPSAAPATYKGKPAEGPTRMGEISKE